ncbi:hypothetical protein JB92DRAFT_3032161 [Gautieria morchelliformis]|nr:hypothetical protein JB92DRAFT_3032161 [Gautieria morchelliformis]
MCSGSGSGGRTVLCILARELAVGAESVDVRFRGAPMLPMLPPAPAPPAGIFVFRPSEPAAPTPLVLERALPVPVPVSATLARLCARDRDGWNTGIGPRRAVGMILDADADAARVHDGGVSADAAEALLVRTDDARTAPALEAGGLGTGGFVVGGGAGFVRTRGVCVLGAGGGGPGALCFCFCAPPPPTPFQTDLTMLFAEDRKPILVAVAFFAGRTYPWLRHIPCG